MRKGVIVIFFLLILCVLGGLLYLTFGVEQLARQKVAQIPGVKLDFESLKVGLAPLRAVCSKLDIVRGENMSISVEKLVAELDFKSLLSNKMIVRRIVLEKPIVEVKGRAGGAEGNFWEGIGSEGFGKQLKYDVSIEELAISGGSVRILNGQRVIKVEEIEGRFANLSPNMEEGASEFNLICKVMGGKLNLQGVLYYPLQKRSLKIKIMGEGFDLITVGEMGLLPPTLKVNKGKGNFGFEGTIEGEHLKLVGELKLTDLGVSSMMEGRFGRVDVGKMVEILGGESEEIKMDFNIDTTFDELREFREKVITSR